ncbi:TIR domain-containing protein [Cohnella silvisoli]|uniref:TIR domain-containing protein n=1 Tax=Cohnella silvisoli TaxID=2873699 RepID=A0ABV1KN12_9BACL|nr:TIR domain-containing protein [Cohnella silvisoli]MCD9020219.1 TIR domain-containing protein [Cohnella silvisoli]
MQNHNKGIIVNGGTFHASVVSIGEGSTINIPSDEDTSRYDYDAAFSFAGEDRSFVEMIARELKEKGIKVFYDEFEEVSIWGQDLFVYLDNLYAYRAAFCVMFISEIYLKKAWCNYEHNVAMKRQYEKGEYILPVCLDQTVLPGITDRYGYLDAKSYSPIQLAEAIRMKLWKNR